MLDDENPRSYSCCFVFSLHFCCFEAHEHHKKIEFYQLEKGNMKLNSINYGAKIDVVIMHQAVHFRSPLRYHLKMITMQPWIRIWMFNFVSFIQMAINIDVSVETILLLEKP